MNKQLKTVEVSAAGVSFGNAWYSHESITGYSADQLNEGNCQITGQQYMQWLAAAPVPPAGDVEVLDGKSLPKSNCVVCGQKNGCVCNAAPAEPMPSYDDLGVPLLRRLIIEQAASLASTIPGATFYNAAEFAVDAVMPNVTRLTAECDELKSMLGATQSKLYAMEALADSRKSELTKARELLRDAWPTPEWYKKRDAFLAHQSAPAAKGETDE